MVKKQNDSAEATTSTLGNSERTKRYEALGYLLPPLATARQKRNAVVQDKKTVQFNVRVAEQLVLEGKALGMMSDHASDARDWLIIYDLATDPEVVAE